MTFEMTDELRAFLTRRTWVAKLSVIRKAGSPWVQPVWFALDGDDIMLVISRESLMGRTLRRDPRVALCVDDVAPPYSFAVFEGEVEVSDDQDLAAYWERDMITRYRPEIERVDEHLATLMGYGVYPVRFRPSRVYFEATVSPPSSEPGGGGSQ